MAQSKFCQNWSDQSLEIVILFSIVKRYNTFANGDDMIPTFPRQRVVSKKKNVHCVYIVFVIEKHNDIFWDIFYKEDTVQEYRFC